MFETKKSTLSTWISENVNGKFFFDVAKTFIGVFLAFSLGNWEDERRSRNSEMTALKEISSELSADIADLETNTDGHKQGLAACRYFKRQLTGKLADADSMPQYLNQLLRQFIVVQHSAAYESLKSRGLEIVKDDSLRLQIVNVYDFQYEIILKLEENYEEHKYINIYYQAMVDLLAPCIHIEDNDHWKLVKPLSELPEADKTKFRMWISQIYSDRSFIIYFYNDARVKLVELKKKIDEKIKKEEG